MSWRVAMASRRARCFAGRLKRAVADGLASSVGPWALRNTHRRKGHRYNTIIVDLDKGRPITTFKGRRVDDVVTWFKSRPQAELDRVKLWSWICPSHFIRRSTRSLAIRLQVIDRFHMVKQAVDALDGVLRSVKNNLSLRRAKELKKLRKRWLKSAQSARCR